MADDIHMNTLLPSLTASAQIRRVKPTDPQNERRTPGERRSPDQKRKQARKPIHDRAARDDKNDQEGFLAADAGPGDKAALSRKEKRTNADESDRKIDIRV